MTQPLKSADEISGFYTTKRTVKFAHDGNGHTTLRAPGSEPRQCYKPARWPTGIALFSGMNNACCKGRYLPSPGMPSRERAGWILTDHGDRFSTSFQGIVWFIGALYEVKFSALVLVHLFLAPLIATRLVNTFAATLPHALSLTRVGVMKGTPHPLVFAGLWRVR